MSMSAIPILKSQTWQTYFKMTTNLFGLRVSDKTGQCDTVVVDESAENILVLILFFFILHIKCCTICIPLFTKEVEWK